MPEWRLWHIIDDNEKVMPYVWDTEEEAVAWANSNNSDGVMTSPHFRTESWTHPTMDRDLAKEMVRGLFQEKH